MKLDIRTISQSDVTGGKNPVVVEGFHPELIPYLEDSFVIFQRCKDQEDYFTSEEPVLNALKPKLYIVDSPSPFDVELCKSFGCDIVDVKTFIRCEHQAEMAAEDDFYHRNSIQENELLMTGGPDSQVEFYQDLDPSGILNPPSFMLDVEEADLNPIRDEGTESHDN